MREGRREKGEVGRRMECEGRNRENGEGGGEKAVCGVRPVAAIGAEMKTLYCTAL